MGPCAEDHTRAAISVVHGVRGDFKKSQIIKLLECYAEELALLEMAEMRARILFS